MCTDGMWKPEVNLGCHFPGTVIYLAFKTVFLTRPQSLLAAQRASGILLILFPQC